jgi:plastocyanin
LALVSASAGGRTSGNHWHEGVDANFAFGPQLITIHSGESVTWSDDDGSPPAIVFKDRRQVTGQTFSRVFDQPGNYEYFCSFHPYITASVVVTSN